MDKFQNKYRIPSTRLQNWDYRWKGAYFITICTKNREHYFGKISDETMLLAGAGILADVFWHEIKNHANNVELGEYVTMPNHIHGILILNGDYKNNGDGDGDGDGDGIVGTGHALSLQQQQQHPTQSDERKTVGQQRFQNIGKNSVSAIIGSYKSAVTKHAHRLGFAMEWQERFYDHIIRDDDEYQRIADYIRTNPLNWENDKFYNNTC